MSAARPMPVRCVCGWSGSLLSKVPCPACSRPYTERITEQRASVLRALHRGEQPVIWPVVRDWLLWARLIVPITERLPPRPEGARHIPGRRRLFALTEAGRSAIGIESGAAPRPQEARAM